jgi:uncharacterized membrane protein
MRSLANYIFQKLYVYVFLGAGPAVALFSFPLVLVIYTVVSRIHCLSVYLILNCAAKCVYIAAQKMNDNNKKTARQDALGPSSI